MKEQKTLDDKIYQWVANHLPKRVVWFCLFRAWAYYRTLTQNNKLPSQVLVWEIINKLDERKKL